jgi:hypothetical protein
MKIARFACPNCQKPLSTKDESLAGRDVECPSCKKHFTLPAASFKSLRPQIPWTGWFALVCLLPGAALAIVFTGRQALFDVPFTALVVTTALLIRDAKDKIHQRPFLYRGRAFMNVLAGVLVLIGVVAVTSFFVLRQAEDTLRQYYKERYVR